MTFEYEGEYGKDEDERGGEDSVPRIVLVKWREAPKNETEGEAEAAYVQRSVVGFLPAPSRSGSGAWSNPNQQQSQTKTE
jgi:hypothetical protein